MEDGIQLVLLPGLGADGRQWQPQQAAFPDLLVPPWIVPLRKETLPHYAARLAEMIPRSKPIVLGGSSFGGMVALEMAKHLQPKSVILIGSCRSPKSICHTVRFFRPILCKSPGWAVTLAKPLAPLGVRTFRNFRPEFGRLCTTMFRDSDPRLIAWGVWAILGWQPTSTGETPIRQIHGQLDRMIQVTQVAADCVIPDGGHLINLTHAEHVNDFIRGVVAGRHNLPS